MSRNVDYTSPADSETADQALTDWKNQPSLEDLRGNFLDAQADHSLHTEKVSAWLDNLNITGSAVHPKVKNRSSIVPKVIRKQAEWRYSSLSEPFLSTDDIFNVSPITAEDKLAAQQNQLVINNQFNTKIDKVTFIDDYVHTAVDEGTVIVRTGWNYQEEEYEEEVELYSYSPNPDFAQVLQELIQMAETDPVAFEQVPDYLKESIPLSVEAQEPMEPTPTGETQLVKKTRVVANHPTAEVCDYRNVVIDPTCMGDLDKAGFITYSFETTLSELKKSGTNYVNLDKILVGSAESILSDPDHSSGDTPTFAYQDAPRKKLVAFEYWGYWDINGTGKVEPIVATWVGRTLIRMEENPYPDRKLPFVKVQYLPKRRENYGEPDGELLTDNQKVIGAVTRGMIDIMARSANGQTGIRKDFLDVVNLRKYKNGEDYQYNGNVDPRVGVYQHVYTEIPQSAQVMLALQNQEAESLTGKKTYNEGVSGNALGDTAALGRSALDAASKRELALLRRLAAGMVKIARKWIAMNAEFLSEEEVVRITNEEFVTVRRDDLAGNFDLELSISTAEEDNSKAQELAFMLQTVGPNSPPELTNMIMADIARLRKMPALAKRLEEFKPEPDPIAVAKAQLEVKLLEAQIATEQAQAAKYAADAGLSQSRAGTEVSRAGNLDSQTDLNNLEFVEQESGVHHERDREKLSTQAEANAKLEIVKAQVNGRDNPKGTAAT